MTYDAIREIQAEEDRRIFKAIDDSLKHTCLECDFRKSGECSREAPGFDNDNPCILEHEWAVKHVMES